MPIEGEPRFETPRVFSETAQRPELVFSSDLETAKREHETFQQTLESLPVGSRRIERGEIHVEYGLGNHHPQVAVRWPKGSDRATQLTLHPITDGPGIEAGLVGYCGTYDVLAADQVIRSTELEELFKAPKGVRFAIKPTLTRWAVGKDEMTILFGDENTWTLYVGMGFLFLGEQWMLIGFHEAGHIPTNHRGSHSVQSGENAAWSVAKRNYASLHHEGNGLFGLLQKPKYIGGRRVNYDTAPTIGEIEKYGLISHALDPDVRLPEQWKGRNMEKAKRTYEQFREIVKRAQNTHFQLSF